MKLLGSSLRVITMNCLFGVDYYYHITLVCVLQSVELVTILKYMYPVFTITDFLFPVISSQKMIYVKHLSSSFFVMSRTVRSPIWRATEIARENWIQKVSKICISGSICSPFSSNLYHPFAPLNVF